MNYDNHIKIRLQNVITLLSIDLIWIIFTTSIINDFKNIGLIQMSKTFDSQLQNNMKIELLFDQLFWLDILFNL